MMRNPMDMRRRVVKLGAVVADNSGPGELGLPDNSGFDYKNQAWVVAGRYVRCGHPDSMPCRCYGRAHAGELADMENVNA